MSDSQHHSAIPLLLRSSSPNAILSRISLGIIDALYRFAKGRLSHVGQKIRELQPCVANGDTSAAVVGVLLVVWVVTPLDHAAPRIVRSGIGGAVCAFCIGGNLALKAAAASGSPLSKVLPGRNGSSSAIANAAPKFAPGPSNNKKAPESFASQVNDVTGRVTGRAAKLSALSGKAWARESGAASFAGFSDYRHAADVVGVSTT